MRRYFQPYPLDAVTESSPRPSTLAMLSRQVASCSPVDCVPWALEPAAGLTFARAAGRKMIASTAAVTAIPPVTQGSPMLLHSVRSAFVDAIDVML